MCRREKLNAILAGFLSLEQVFVEEPLLATT